MAKLQAIWSENNRSYYEKRGYIFTQYGERFAINFTDMNKNSKFDVIVPCDECGTDIVIGFRSYYKNSSENRSTLCDDCKKRLRLDVIFERVVHVCDEKMYTMLTTRAEIVDEHTPIYYMCPSHGITHTKIRSLLEGKGCYQCGRDAAAIKQVLTTLNNRQETLYNNALLAAAKRGYTLISNKNNIVNNTTYVDYICSKHGVQRMRVNNFINGKGCSDCVPEHNRELFKLSADEVEKRICECGGHLLNKEDYKNQTEKNLLIECFECGQPFTTSLRNFTQHGGQVCPKCSGTKSLGEKRIQLYLEEYGVQFIPQKWFSGCRDRNPLPFDFYLPQHNTLIEFDGRQHFEEVEFFTYSLAMVKKHDAIKNEYCSINNIRLIRIPYWDYNKIEEILNQELISHKDIV